MVQGRVQGVERGIRMQRFRQSVLLLILVERHASCIESGIDSASYAVDPAQGLVLGQCVPGLEGRVLAALCSFVVVEALTRNAHAGNAVIGARVFIPDHGRVLDRHRVRIGLALYLEVEARLALAQVLA